MVEKTAAIIGGGTIGGGWVARFLLHGWHVNVYDQDPRAAEKIATILDRARQVFPQLLDSALPKEGTLTICKRIESAVRHADWVQESVPERLDVKRQVLLSIQNACPNDCIIASSSSGFQPSELNDDRQASPVMIVAHPYNPVYLLPLVELVGLSVLGEQRMKQAQQMMLSIGMKPMIIRKEIPAHVGDRLLEAVWRESLWLVKDQVVTTEEIDDIIRYSFGLRWAQMGLFETYRIAGGEAGMTHFLNQFGPTLALPWTKLTEVPEFNDELIKLISEQSDAQSGDYSIQQLEQIRDDNLLGMMRVLKDNRWGVGQVLHEHDSYLAEQQGLSVTTQGWRQYEKIEPMRLYQGSVLPSWIDANQHMTEFRYLQVFSACSDELLALVGVVDDYLQQGSYFTAETHIIHHNEAKLGAILYGTTQLLHVDEKRLHLVHMLYRQHDDELLASAEQMLLHVDMYTGNVAPAATEVLQPLQALAKQHQLLASPLGMGRHIGMNKSS